MNEPTLSKSIRSIQRVPKTCLLILEGEPKADVEHLGQLCLFCSAPPFAAAPRCSLFWVTPTSFTCFSGHVFKPQSVQRALTECIMFLLMGSSDGAKIQRRVPFRKNTSCYTTCYTEHYKIRQLQSGTEMLWLCLPCESNSLACKTTPSDYFSQNVAHSQGSLSYGRLI